MSDLTIVEQVFFAALERPTEAERTRYVEAACDGAPHLLRQVMRLLQAHPAAHDFLTQSPVADLAAELADLAAHGAADEQTASVVASHDLTENDLGPALSLLAPTPRPDALGRLGHFEILELLGRGGFGCVFRAYDEVLQRAVAIKVFLPPQIARSGARQQFLREARATAKLRHENVVQVYGIEEQSPPYLVMEYIAGGTLQQRLDRDGPLSWRDVGEIGRQIATGLAAAHDAGLIHRDIKPANIMIDSSDPWLVKITDFGIARATDDVYATYSPGCIGTPMYMAPEQVLDTPLDHRADLFSLGNVLYALCAGAAPFRATTLLAALRQVTEETPPPLTALDASIPAWLSELIAQLQAKNREDRIATAREVAVRLSQGLSGKYDRVELRPPMQTTRRRPATRITAAMILLALVAVAWLAPRVPPAIRRDPLPSPQVGGVEEWRRSIAALPPDRQVAEVVLRLRELNPNFDGQVVERIEGGVVTGLEFNTDQVRDISPVRALAGLETLVIPGTFPQQGILADIATLRGLRLKSLTVRSTQVTDLSPLAGMPLTSLHISFTPVADLSPLADMPLVQLDCASTAIVDFKALQGSRLETLNAMNLAVRDLEPLSGLPLKVLDLHGSSQVTNFRLLRAMPLEWLNLSRIAVADLGFLDGKQTLHVLCLHDTPISDAGLAPLRTCANLRELVLENTQVTAPGVRTLQEALPQCAIKWPGNGQQP